MEDKAVISRELFDLADQLKARKDLKKELPFIVTFGAGVLIYWL